MKVYVIIEHIKMLNGMFYILIPLEGIYHCEDVNVSILISGPVDYLYVYIYSWEFMGSMDKYCPDYIKM